MYRFIKTYVLLPPFGKKEPAKIQIRLFQMDSLHVVLLANTLFTTQLFLKIKDVVVLDSMTQVEAQYFALVAWN